MLRLFLRLGVAVLAVVLVARRSDLAAVGAALAAVRPGAVVLATVLAFVANYVIAFRLCVLMASQGVTVRPAQTFVINLAAYFYNLFVPVGGVGVAALRLQRLSRSTHGRFTAALTAMVCDRLAAVTSIGLIGLACWVADAHVKPAGGLLVLLGGTATVGLLIAPRAVPEHVRHFVRELHAGGAGTWWAAALLRMSNALGSVARLSPTTLASILGISLLAQVPGVLLYMALGYGLGLPISAMSWGWIRSVVVLLTVAPLSIGGLGVREGALVFALAAFGVPAHDALAVSILIFATTILAPGVVGGVLEAVYWLRGTR